MGWHGILQAEDMYVSRRFLPRTAVNNARIKQLLGKRAADSKDRVKGRILGKDGWQKQGMMGRNGGAGKRGAEDRHAAGGRQEGLSTN